MEFLLEVIAFLQSNWPAIEQLAVRLAEDLFALYVLLVAFAEIVKKFFPVFGKKLKAAVLTPITK